jgi:hypothetical protein
MGLSRHDILFIAMSGTSQSRWGRRLENRTAGAVVIWPLHVILFVFLSACAMRPSGDSAQRANVWINRRATSADVTGKPITTPNDAALNARRYFALVSKICTVRPLNQAGKFALRANDMTIIREEETWRVQVPCDNGPWRVVLSAADGHLISIDTCQTLE